VTLKLLLTPHSLRFLARVNGSMYGSCFSVACVLPLIEIVCVAEQDGTIVTQPGRSAYDTFESVVNAALNNLTSQLAQTAANALRSDNSLLAMIESGSKGSVINVSQIAGCVGQQNVEGQVRSNG
jgi:hypothetical protein